MKIRIAIRKLLRFSLKFTLWIVGLLMALSLTISLLLLVPAIQQYAVDQGTEFLSAKTGMEAKVGSIYIRFPKTVRISEISIKDHQSDTLFFCETISIRASLLSLIRKRLHIERFKLQGLSSHVYRNHKDSSFNFQPIAKLFAEPQNENETSQASNWDISINKLELDSIRIRYEDLHDSTFADLRFDRFLLVANSSDLIHQQIDLDNLALSGLELNLLIGDKYQRVDPLNIPESGPLTYPQLDIANAELEDITFNLSFTSGKLDFDSRLGYARIIPGQLDLERKRIELKELSAREINTQLRINSEIQDGSSTQAPGIAFEEGFASASTFGEFPWAIQVEHAAIHDAYVKLDLDDLTKKEGEIDYKHMEYQNFSVDVSDLYFDQNQAGVILNQLKISEQAGLRIASLSGKFKMNNEGFQAEKIALQSAKSNFSGDVQLSYPGLRNIGYQIAELGVEASLSGQIHLAEIDPFTSVRHDFPVLRQIENIRLDSISTTGKLADLTLRKVDIHFGDSTDLLMSATIHGLPSSEIGVSFRVESLTSCRNDVVRFLSDSLLPTSLQIPQSISVTAQGKADLNNAEIELTLESNIGSIDLQAQKNGDELHASAAIEEFDIGNLLDQEILGKAHLKSEINGSLVENTVERIKAKTEIMHVDFNGYTYRNGMVDLLWENDKFDVSTNLNDEFLSANLHGEFIPGSQINHVSFILEVEVANLQKLNVLEEYFNVQGQVAVDLDIASRDEFRGLIKINNTNLDAEDRSFHIDEIRFESDINRDYTNFLLSSEILDAQLTGNTKLTELKDALVDHLDLFISLPDSLVNQKDFVFEFNLDLKQPDILTDFFLTDLQHIELERCYAKYVDVSNILEVELIVPKLDYKGYAFHNLAFEIESEENKATANMNFDSLNFSSYGIQNLRLHSEFAPNSSDILLSIRDTNDSAKYQFAALLNYQDSTYKIVIDENKTIIDYQQWRLPPDNYLVLRTGVFYANATVLQNGDQKLWLETADTKLTVNYQNLLIENFLNIVDYDSLLHLFSGKINGHVNIIDPFAALSINARVDVDQLSYRDELIGNIESTIAYGQNLPFKINAVLDNEVNSIRFSGSSSKYDGQTRTSMILESDITEASSFQPFFSNYIDDLDGALKGRISLSDNADSRSMNGNLEFDQLAFTIIPTNTDLNFNGSFNIVDNVLAFDSFIIKDSLNNQLHVDGLVNFSDQNNPLYNVTLKADEFLLINSPMSYVQDISGKLRLGIDVNLQGSMTKLGVTSNFTIREGTDLTYVMPGRELELITDEGIVQFVDFENEEFQQVLEQESTFIGDSIISLVRGIDLVASIEIDPRAQFTIFIDPNSGDLTKFRIQGKLNYKYNEIQQGNLNGLIEFAEGHYDLSFYGLVKKRFVYDPGSSISWAGEVMDGEVNFSARHTVRTNSVGLVSNEISGAEVHMYNQRLPYDVILEVGDKIGYPSINFGIDLPQRHRASFPTIDSKLNILNQPGMESERNKQVFALLVGGTFIPENPGVFEGSSGSNFATTAARNSVSAIMTQQLNRLTGQFIRGIDIDMGVSSYDEYNKENSQVVTQLDLKVSKNLFNDRVSAEVESHINLDGSVQQMGQSTAGMTEFAVSYKLTDQGNYRIKAFRENAYDIFDGEIQNSGIAFIFVREFESFKDWRSTGKKSDEVQLDSLDVEEK